MKILITDIHHGNGGGHVTYVAGLLRGLKGEHDITVAAPQTGRLYKTAAQMDGLRVIPGRFTSRPLPLIAEVLELRGFLRREAFDVVHVNGGADHRHVMLASLGLASRPAIVWTKHNTNPVSSAGHRLRAALGTDMSIAVSNYVGNMLSASAYRQRSIRVIPNGVDLRYFQPISTDRFHQLRYAMFGHLADDVLILGSTAGTDQAKGWLDLVRAISLLPPANQEKLRIIVAGDIPAQSMQDEVRRLGQQDRVVFPGLVQDVRVVLGACNAGFVLSYREALSYAAREAMAMGLPVLVSDAGGLPESVSDGLDGWIVPSGDIHTLAIRLKQLIDNPLALRSMGEQARRRAEQQFCSNRCSGDTVQAYTEAMGLACLRAASI